METIEYEDAAIEAVRDFLVYLLSRSEWCRAESVGKALIMLVDSKTRRQETDKLFKLRTEQLDNTGER